MQIQVMKVKQPSQTFMQSFQIYEAHWDENTGFNACCGLW